MCQLIDQRDLWVPGDHGVGIHLVDDHALIGDRQRRHDLQVADLLGGVGPAMGFHEADHHVGATLFPAVRLLQHGVGLAYTRCGAQVDTQPALHRLLFRLDAGQDGIGIWTCRLTAHTLISFRRMSGPVATG